MRLGQVGHLAISACSFGSLDGGQPGTGPCGCVSVPVPVPDVPACWLPTEPAPLGPAVSASVCAAGSGGAEAAGVSVSVCVAVGMLAVYACICARCSLQ